MKLKVGGVYTQRTEKEPSKLTGDYLYDCKALVTAIYDGIIFATVFADTERKATFDMNGVRSDGKAWLVENES